MRLNKMKSISKASSKPFNELIKELYIDQTMTAKEISDKIFETTKILITPRSIQRKLKEIGVIRSLSDAFNLSISKGRKSYDHLRKNIKSSSYRKGIAPKLRYMILKRDGFKCVLCGKTSDDDRLEIDHIVPIVAGGNNNINNLRTLCSECNKGKMLLEEKHYGAH
jgi:hypothetical protein